MTIRKILTAYAAGLAFVVALTAGRTVSAGTAEPISVDVRDLACRRVSSPADLTYSPYWLSSADGGARAVRIDVVTNPDTPNAATNTLTTGSAGAEALYAWTPAASAQPYSRLLHWTLDGGSPTGLPLVCDVVIGKPSQPGTVFAADSRTNSLQEVADANGIAALAYSPIWTFGGNSVRIERVRHIETPSSTTTNTLFQSGASVESAYTMAASTCPSGIFTLRHITLDAANQLVGDVLTAAFVINRPSGTLIRIF